MNEEFKHIELIEQYYEGKMSVIEITDFETRLITDSDFKEEFELYKIIVAGIKENGADNLKARLKEADKELDSVVAERKDSVIEKRKPKKDIKIIYWLVAASVLLIVSFGVVWNLSTKTNLSQLADNYYEKDRGIPTEMSVNKQLLADVMNSYKKGNFVNAKKQLEPLLMNNVTNDTLQYYFGIISYELADYKTSSVSFSKVCKGSVYYDKAQYRLILVYLKTKDKDRVVSKINECLLDKNQLYYDKLLQLKFELPK